MKIHILPSAIEDLQQGFDFYDGQQAGVGEYFQDALFSDIDSLRLFAGIHRECFGFHRALSKRFPFAIYYAIESDGSVLVYRVLDMRQDPDRLSDELTKDRTRR